MPDAPALRYAQSLAQALYEKHWKRESPNWQVNRGLLSVLTQIDNMTAGLVRPESVTELREALKDLLETDEEYVRINNLHNSDGTPATNHAMRRARAALEST